MASMQTQIFKAITRFHIFLYRSSGGKIWKTMLGFPILILTTTGRKSGKERSTPVVYIKDGDAYAIAASANGSLSHPAWYYNITANTAVTIEVDGKPHQATAEILEGEERTRLYEEMKAKGDNFAKYEKATQGIREIPVIRLSVN